MKKTLFLLSVVLLFALTAFSQAINEVEPNGCITLVGGGDAYQTLYSGMGVYGSVSTGDTGGCLYFSYNGGDEFIEDLYAFSVTQAGYYSINLLFYGYVDADIYLMDQDLNLLNPSECGDFTCGVTCGNPEIVNAYLYPGTYVVGVSLATVYFCFDPGPTDYFLSITAGSEGDAPVVNDISKASSPFRLLIFGDKFYSGTRVVVNGNEWTDFTIKGTNLLKLKKGNPLKAMFPKDGSWVPITIISGANRSTTVLYNRLGNAWKEGGAVEKAVARPAEGE